jgi:hypothetical protein
MWNTGAPTANAVAEYERELGGEREFWIQLGFGPGLRNHGLYQVARLLCDYSTGDRRPNGVVAWSYGAAAEFAAQLGQRVLLHGDFGMHAEAFHMFQPGRSKYRSPAPLPEFKLGHVAQIVPSRFAPANCAFCQTFVAAENYFMGRRNGTDLYVPFCEKHHREPESYIA